MRSTRDLHRRGRAPDRLRGELGGDWRTRARGVECGGQSTLATVFCTNLSVSIQRLVVLISVVVDSVGGGLACDAEVGCVGVVGVEPLVRGCGVPRHGVGGIFWVAKVGMVGFARPRTYPARPVSQPPGEGRPQTRCAR